jgi:hypothetical protein
MSVKQLPVASKPKACNFRIPSKKPSQPAAGPNATTTTYVTPKPHLNNKVFWTLFSVLHQPTSASFEGTMHICQQWLPYAMPWTQQLIKMKPGFACKHRMVQPHSYIII